MTVLELKKQERNVELNILKTIKDENLTKKCFIAELIKRALDKYLDYDDIVAKNDSSIYTLPIINEEIDIIDFEINGLNIHVIPTIDRAKNQNVYIPTIYKYYHYKPDMILFVNFTKAYTKMDMLGFITDIDLNNLTLSKDLLLSADNLIEVLQTLKNKKQNTAPNTIETARELIASFIDNELSDEGRRFFLKNIISSSELRKDYKLFYSMNNNFNLLVQNEDIIITEPNNYEQEKNENENENEDEDKKQKEQENNIENEDEFEIDSRSSYLMEKAINKYNDDIEQETNTHSEEENILENESQETEDIFAEEENILENESQETEDIFAEEENILEDENNLMEENLEVIDLNEEDFNLQENNEELIFQDIMQSNNETESNSTEKILEIIDENVIDAIDETIIDAIEDDTEIPTTDTIAEEILNQNDFESEDDLFEMLSEIAESDDIANNQTDEVIEEEYSENTNNENIEEEYENIPEEFINNNSLESENIEEEIIENYPQNQEEANNFNTNDFEAQPHSVFEQPTYQQTYVPPKKSSPLPLIAALVIVGAGIYSGLTYKDTIMEKLGLSSNIPNLIEENTVANIPAPVTNTENKATVPPTATEEKEQPTAPAPVAETQPTTDAKKDENTTKPEVIQKETAQEKLPQLPTTVEPPKPKNLNDAIAKALTKDYDGVRISNISWEVSETLLENPEVKTYLTFAGRNIKYSLTKDLLAATEPSFKDTVSLLITYRKDGALAKVNVASSSGSSQIDELIVKSIKNILKISIMPPINIKEPEFSIKLVIKL